MQKNPIKEILIFILIPKTQWGSYIIHPCCVVDDGEFYSYKGKHSQTEGLTTEIKEIIHLCDRCENSSLYESFGKKKHKSERDFVEKTNSEISKNVKAFIDLTVAKIISLITIHNLPIYLRETRLESLYKEDKISMNPTPLKPLLGFFRDSEKIRYTLRLRSAESIFTPTQCGLKIITDNPGIVLIDKQLYYLPEKFAGTRLQPFLNKEEITIPRQNEQMYFRKFILKNVYNSEIEVDGFDVIQPKCVKKASLWLEKNLLSEPIFALEFHYNNRLIKASDPRKIMVELKEQGDEYCFFKITRDENWEKEICALLESKELLCTSAGSFSIHKKSGWIEAVKWIEKHAKMLQQEGISVSQNRLNITFYTGTWKISYSEKNEADWFELHMEIILENGRKIRFQDMRECILSGKREYMIDDHIAFIIPEEWFARYTGVLLFGKRNDNNLLLHRSQLSLINYKDEKDAHPKKEENNIPIELPIALHAVLRDYQQKGFEWLYRLFCQGAGACLADDMGLGKTVQTIALLLKYKEEALPREDNFIPEQQKKTFRTCLIIAPASVVHNWKNELKKFAPSLTTLIYIGSGSLRSEKRKALFRWDAVITTYQIFRADIDFFSQEGFGIVVFDEAQNLKNPSSLVHRAALQIKADFCVALSGTPIENSLSDLWALMEVINKGLLGNYVSFQDYFIRPIVADLNGIRSEMLHKLVSPYILRRTKEEVLQDLPERMNEIIFCDPTDEQKQLYEEELSKTRNLIMERVSGIKNENSRFVILQSLTHLRKLAIDPRLLFPNHSCESTKFGLIFNMLEEIANTGHKVLLFSDYVSFLKLVAEEMELRKWNYALLTGNTRNREEVIHRFSNTSECHFFLISLKAGGVGLNLTEADYVFILDPWWNIAAEEQAISRAYRIGQKRSVFVYRFITEGTLEEKIMSMQKDKQDLVEAVIKSGLTNDIYPELNTVL